MSNVKNKNRGFTLIELIVFIVVLGVLAGGILNSYMTVLRSTANVSKIMIASETAARCISWYVGQRRLYGYASISSPNTTVPTFCTAPTGYSITANVSNTTVPPDVTSNYKTIAVGVSYGGVQQTSASLLIGNY